MSDSVQIIFDGDLGPLEAKQAIAKAELNAFVTESEAEIKGIASAGASIGAASQKGAESFSQYYKPVIVDLRRQIDSLGSGFEKVLGAEAAKKATAGLDEVSLSLKQLNIGGYEAAASNLALQDKLEGINKALGVYQLQLAKATQENIFFAESQATAGKASEASAGLGIGARPLQGYGGLFRASGLTNAGINETEANAALNLLGKLGGGTGDLAKIQATLVASTSKVAEAEKALGAAQSEVTAALSARQAAYVEVIAAEEAELVSDAQLIAADNALIETSAALTAAKSAEAVATETLAAANAKLSTAAAAASSAAAGGLDVIVAILSPLIAGAAALAVISKLKEEADKRLESEENISHILAQETNELHSAVGEHERLVQHLKEEEALSNNILSLTKENNQAGVQGLLAKTEADAQARAREVDSLRKVVELDKERQKSAEDRPVSGLVNTALGTAGLTNTYTAQQKRADVRDVTQDLDVSEFRLKEAEGRQKDAEDAVNKLKQASKDITSNQDKLFADSFESRRKSEEDAKQFAEKQAEEAVAEAKKFAESVKQGQEEIKKSLTGYKDEFIRLFLAVDNDNPFAKQTLESAKALETLEEKLKGAGPELRKQATDLQAAASAQQAYTVQINSAFQTIDLKAQADRFRNPTQKELQGRLDSRIAEFQRTSNSTNPEVFNDFKRDQQGVDEFNRSKNQDIVDQKLDVVARAKSPAEQAIADRALTAFAGGLNPDDLTQSERSKIADAFERSAVRNETRQEEALTVQKELLATMKSIDKRGATLSGINAEGGKTKLDITLKDDTSDKKATAATATTDDVAKTYDLGFAGGTNK